MTREQRRTATYLTCFAALAFILVVGIAGGGR